MSLSQPGRALVSQSDNAINPKARIPRSVFRNTWSRKTAFNAGRLIPFLVDEILPGDHVKYDLSIYMRLETLINPMFDQQRVDTHIFYVPNRLVWTNWKKFMGERADPLSSVAFTIPKITSTTASGEAVGSLWDHLGVPVAGQIEGGAMESVNALPFRMYNLIYNEWFRDQNQQVSLTVDTGDTTPSPGPYSSCQIRGKSQDYFTTCLPYPQSLASGGAAIGYPTQGAIAPMTGIAPVTGIGAGSGVFGVGPITVTEPLGAATYAFFKGPIGPGANEQFYVRGSGASGVPLIYTDLAANAGNSGISIIALRQAWAIQQLLEAKNRSGTRYKEIIHEQFGVNVPDYRLQRPEYIGGGQSPLNITPIAQTTPTSGVAVGSLGAAGTVAGQHSASYAAQEHGYIIGIISVKSELSYQQGLHKHWFRDTDLDFYTPKLADLPDQAVTTKEIYYRANPTLDNVVFGYQERWQEYRMRYSDVTGIMRSTATGTRDSWHLAQRFNTAPQIGAQFVLESPPMARVLAAGALADGEQYKVDINYRRIITRAMPTFGIPATMGRF